MIELWKSIEGYEGIYEVSNFGNIRSLDRTITQTSRWGTDQTYKLYSQLIKPKMVGTYQAVKLNNRGCKNVYVHRLVAQTFIDNPSKFKEVNHIDGNKLNNKVDNLEWVSRIANQEHSYNMGLSKSGSDSHLAKLTEKDVATIIFLKETSGLSYAEVASLFNISGESVSNMCRGLSWKRPLIRERINKYLEELKTICNIGDL